MQYPGIGVDAFRAACPMQALEASRLEPEKIAHRLFGFSAAIRPVRRKVNLSTLHRDIARARRGFAEQSPPCQLSEGKRKIHA